MIDQPICLHPRPPNPENGMPSSAPSPVAVGLRKRRGKDSVVRQPVATLCECPIPTTTIQPSDSSFQHFDWPDGLSMQRKIALRSILRLVLFALVVKYGNSRCARRASPPASRRVPRSDQVVWLAHLSQQLSLQIQAVRRGFCVELRAHHCQIGYSTCAPLLPTRPHLCTDMVEGGRNFSPAMKLYCAVLFW